MATNRNDIGNKFENGDIPSQADFKEIFDSFVHKEEDKATIDMIDAGIDDEHYVTPALLRVGLQNIGAITGGGNLPYKQYEDNFEGSFITLERYPIESSVKVFKNGQLLLEGEDGDYTINYETAVVTFSSEVMDRNIEIDYWFKSTEPIPGNGTNYVDLTTNQTVGGQKTFAEVANFIGVQIDNGGSNRGLHVINNGDVEGVFIRSTDSGDSLVINDSVTGTGTPLKIQKDDVTKFSVDSNGQAIANSFVKAGGLSTEFLMADGSVSTSAGGGSQDLQSVLDADSMAQINAPLNIDALGVTFNSSGDKITLNTVGADIDLVSDNFLNIRLPRVNMFVDDQTMPLFYIQKNSDNAEISSEAGGFEFYATNGVMTLNGTQIATLGDIGGSASIPTLQDVVTAGSFATTGMTINETSGTPFYGYSVDGNGGNMSSTNADGLSVSSEEGFGLVAYSLNNTAGVFNKNNFGGSIVEFRASGNTTASVGYDGSVNGNSFIKTGGLDTEYLMADGSVTTGGSSPLGVLDEGNGNGYRLSNADPLNFGNIGADAVDFSYSETPSDVLGATGSSAFAMGSDVTASNYFSTVFGYLIDNNGIGSFDSGFNLKDNGYTNSLFGIGHDVTSMNTTVVGQASNIISDQIEDFNYTSTKKLFVVGNGTIQNADDNYTVNTRSDALVVRLNGAVEAPSLTNALIDADTTGKTLVTKEYLEANYTKFETTAPSSATDTGVIGEVRITSTYVYYCIATNTWVRAALATW